MYHRVLLKADPFLPGVPDRTHFEIQIKCLARWFNVLSLNEGTRRLAEGSLPRRAVSITFDDGYRDNLLVATPILQKYRLPATFFIATGFLGQGRMWNDTLIEAIRSTSRTEVDLTDFGLSQAPLSTTTQRLIAIDRLIAATKYLPDIARHNAVTAVASRLGSDLPDNLMLEPEQVRKLHQCGMEIGGHTVTHPILSGCDNDRAEISEGKATLEDLIQSPVRGFAYPNGKPQRDYRQRHCELVRQLGFDYAVSTDWGTAQRKDDPFQLPRVGFHERNALLFILRMLKSAGDTARNLLPRSVALV